MVAVIGTTGVGKSNLAVQLARRINGHVVNGDSMQVYRGMDVITNKPDSNERQMAPHHLFDFLDPCYEYSVSEYTKDCLAAVQTIHETNNIPVIVGGTNYYIQSVLWNDSIIETAQSPGLANKLTVKESCHGSIEPELADTLCYLLEHTDARNINADAIAEFAKTAPLHETLQKVDMVMANRWHPNDIRKIRRSLEIFYTTGIPHSEWYAKQKAENVSASNARYLYVN